MNWNLQYVSIADLSSVRISAQVCRFEHDRLEALILTFSGTVPAGSAGNRDARFMSFITGQYVVLTLPSCVVFDLRNLTYAFGDGLLRLPAAVQEQSEHLPCVFVASERCRAGLRSLLAPAGSETDSLLFEDLDPALSRALALAREYDSRNRC